MITESNKLVTLRIIFTAHSPRKDGAPPRRKGHGEEAFIFALCAVLFAIFW